MTERASRERARESKIELTSFSSAEYSAEVGITIVISHFNNSFRMKTKVLLE